jgi:hypothetical protein
VIDEQQEALPQAGDCPAYPAAARWLAGLTVLAFAVGLVAVGDDLGGVSWNRMGVAVFAIAAIAIVWMGYWILRSRTRLDGETLHQTWLWDKRATVDEVAQMRMVHWPLMAWIIAPRLFVRLRNGAMLWFQASDAALLASFAKQVGARHVERLRGGQ